MPRCTCSTRALEAIIQDFTAISLHPQRAKLASRNRRTFGTRSALFRPEQDEVHATDDASTPTSFSQLQPKAKSLNSMTKATVLELPAISQSLPPALPGSASSPTTDRTKAVNRKLRKLRRMQQGTYRAVAESRKSVPLDELHGQQEEDLVALKQKDLESASSRRSDMPRDSPAAEQMFENDLVPTIQARTASTRKPRPTKSAQPTRPALKLQTPSTRPKRERWMIDKAALLSKFGSQGWAPRKRLSPDTLEGLRALHASDPSTYTTPMLAQHFEVTPEAIRRILRSKWKPNTTEIEDRVQRWERRGMKKWEEMAELGIKPPKKWRELGAGNPVVQRKVEKRQRTRAEDGGARWKDMADQAARLPFESTSLEERIL